MTTHNHFIKDISRRLIIKYHGYWNPYDYQHNKFLVDEMCSGMTKKIRNIVAGYITHLLNNEFFQGVKVKKLRGGSRSKKSRRRKSF